MKRIAVALAAAAALADCGDGSSSSRSVLLYWSFQRNTLPPAPAAPRYDPVDLNDGLDGACAESGVDYVEIRDEGGRIVNPELPQVPCKLAGVHGVQINGLRRGTRTWTLTGYRNDGVPLFAGTTTFDLGRSAAVETVLAGVRDDLDVNIGFFTATGAPGGATCEAAGVQFLLYSLFDGLGTKVAETEVPCQGPAVLRFQVAAGNGLDRDTYTLRVLGFPDANPATPPSHDDQRFPECLVKSFAHYGADTGPNGWNVPLFRRDPAATPCP